MRIVSVYILFHLFFYLPLIAQAESGIPSKYRCSSEATIRAQLDNYIPSKALRYRIFKFNGRLAKAALAKGKSVDVPLVDHRGRYNLLKGKAKRISVRSGSLTHGTHQLSATETQLATLGNTPIYQFDCSSKTAGAYKCGALTFLNPSSSKYEGMFIDKDTGASFFESAESLLQNLSGQPQTLAEDCAIAYNAAQVKGFDIDGTFGEATVPTYQAQTQDTTIRASARVVRSRTYGIHLDAEGNFTNLDYDNVFTKMQSMLAGVNLIFSELEPITGQKFDITLRAQSMRAWNLGFGPSETNPELLRDFINDPTYHPEIQQGDNELYHFFVGYDLEGGTVGYAKTICKVSNDGFGDDVAFQKTRSYSQQVPDVDGTYQVGTFYGRIIVMAHEIGHILGGRHEHGSGNQCAGGRLPNFCGSTLMKSRAAGGVFPDFRKPFFSRRNDDNISRCIVHADALN